MLSGGVSAVTRSVVNSGRGSASHASHKGALNSSLPDKTVGECKDIEDLKKGKMSDNCKTCPEASTCLNKLRVTQASQNLENDENEVEITIKTKVVKRHISSTVWPLR